MTGRGHVAVALLAAGGLLLPLAPAAAPAPTEPAEPAGPTDAAGDPTPPAFDLDTGNAPVELIVPAVIEATLASVSPSAGDASLVLRITTLVTNGWFDAIAPYSPTAVGVHSDLGRRPAEEGGTDRNRNVAMLYASRQVLDSVLPQHSDDWRAMLLAAGLDPDDASTDLSTAVGIGNVAGAAVVAAREHDGMNQLGDSPDSAVPGMPYADTTGYAPVNSPYRLEDPARWQPLTVTDGSGIFRSQVFVTPQWSEVEAYSYADVDAFSVPAPRASQPRGRRGWDAYVEQARDVLTVSEALTDEQKLAAELFDDKFASLGFSVLAVQEARSLTLEEFVHYDFLVNVAAHDAGVAVWKEKIRHDAVRPVTAIRYLSGALPVRGGRLPAGTPLDAPTWDSYLATGDHPEYPSGSAAFCAAHAQASRRYLGSDDLGWTLRYPTGSSRVQPGAVPAEETTLSFPTWTAFEEACGLSRVHGGVHFRPAVTASQELARPIGDLAYEFVRSHVEGEVER